ncbi:MAG: class I SAM-dependent rRNA methyltransferase [Chthoniobacterales bacterium]
MSIPILLHPEMSGGWISHSACRQLESEGTTAYRIYTSSTAWIDRYGPYYVISSTQEREALQLLEVLKNRASESPYEAVFFRRLVIGAKRENTPVLLDGREPNERVCVLENRLKFWVDFQVGYSTGLFCDQRKNRFFLAEKVRGLGASSLLNCFSYTCAFSVAAAQANPELRTTNLDLSAKFLNWGKENYILNELTKGEQNKHRFWRCDVMRRLPRLCREGSKFDIIILDPPTFSRGEKGRVFRVADDFEELADRAVQCASEQGWILLSTNHSALSSDDLKSIGAAAALKNGRKYSFHYEAPPDEYDGAAAASVWMQLEV